MRRGLTENLLPSAQIHSLFLRERASFRLTTLCCAPCLFRSACELLCVFIILLFRSEVQVYFSRSAKSAVEISELMTIHSFDDKETGRLFPIPNYTDRRSALQQAAVQNSVDDDSGFQSHKSGASRITAGRKKTSAASHRR